MMEKKRGRAGRWVLVLCLALLLALPAGAAPRAVRRLSWERLLGSNTVSFTWREIPEAEGYLLSVSESKDFSEENLLSCSGEKAVFTGKTGVRYYARVCALFPEQGPWGRTVSFRLSPLVLRRRERAFPGKVRVEVRSGDATVSGEYSDSFFLEPERKREELFRLSALALLASYAGGGEDPLSGFLSGGRSALTRFWEDCGFATGSVLRLFTGGGENSTREDNDHCTLYAARKTLPGGKPLIALLISGYSDGGYEWLSNLSLGEEAVHEGFYRAAAEAKELLYALYPDLNSSVLWICGHSRGAAVAALTAGELLDAQEHPEVYCYGFGTPRFLRAEEEKESGAGQAKESEAGQRKENAGAQGCIINLQNEGDLVPDLPPAAWGYEGAGETLSFSMDARARRFYRQSFGMPYLGMSGRQKEAWFSELLADLPDQEGLEERLKERLREGLEEGNLPGRGQRTFAAAGISLAVPHTIEAYVSFLFTHGWNGEGWERRSF